MIAEPLTEKEVDLIHKFKLFFLNNFKEISKLDLSPLKQLFVISDLLIILLTSIKEAEPTTFQFIINTVTKGEQDDTTNNSKQ